MGESIKSQIAKKFKNAFEEAIDNSYKKIKENVDEFYSQGEGESPYVRTGQLSESLTIDSFSLADTFANAKMSLDTDYTYNPSGRDTKTIYTYAETGELHGKGGFWKQSEEDVENELKKAFGKMFK